MIPAFPHKALQALLPLAFAEDEGPGDVTSEATLDAGHRSRAALLCKENGVLAGVPVMEAVFRHRGLAPRIEWLAREGDAVQAGQVLARVEEETRGLLVCERILLNFMQRLSGIATATRRFAEAAAPVKILDTRKTLPGYRELDKYAVAVGGGVNHRHGLFDQILIKDNHAAANGSVRAAADRALARAGRAYKVEAEVRTLEELESLLDAPVDILLLDNMDDATLARAVARARAAAPHLKLEASGNMTLERARALRNSGLDFISVGELTHSVRALDLSLKIGSATPAGGSRAF
ncbi:MAG: nicotinate-nucleotide pyrophosphorylase [Fibrobacteria bacterium]|jgi:nicotinate-nucleotide pyrophosphorylase (carboxylating)|nr:nicotinate-nucleotide pyrophosphorylase [Fibrobacteria bacterium]